MAIFINSTQVISSSATVDWNRLKNKPGFMSSVVHTFTGDGSNPMGSNCRLQDVTFNAATGVLTCLFNTNCACACQCDCGGGDGGG